MAVPKFNNGDEPPTSIFANQLKKKKKKETSRQDRSLFTFPPKGGENSTLGRQKSRGKRTRWRRFGRGTRGSRIPVCLTIVQEVFHSPSRTVSWPRTCNRRGGISWTELQRGNSVEIPRKERSFRSDNSIADSRKSSEPEESHSDATASRKVCGIFGVDGDFYLSVLFFLFFFFLIIVLRANIETIEVKRRNLFLKIVEMILAKIWISLGISIVNE